MCWLLLVVGLVMLSVGIALVAAFVIGRRTEGASLTRVEWMIFGALLASLGPLLIALGGSATVCRALGLE